MKYSLDDTYFKVGDRIFCITGTWWKGENRRFCIREYANRRFSNEFERDEHEIPEPLNIIAMNLPDRAWLSPEFNKSLEQHT